MKKKTRNRIIIAFIMVLLVVGSSVGTFYVAANIFQGKIFIDSKNTINFSDDASKGKIAKFREVKNKIDEDFYGEYSEDNLIEGAIGGMVDALGDPYTKYYTKEEMEERNNQLNGFYYGIGVSVTQQSDGYLLIEDVTSGSPAMESGIARGDVIISIDNVDLLEMTYEEVFDILKTNEKKINLGLKRGADKLHVDVTVRVIEVVSVSSKIIDGDIGYIIIRQFDSKTANAFENELKVLLGKGIKYLIIDLRNNGGGLASEMSRIADTILPEGDLIYYEVDRKGETISSKYSDVNSTNVPIAVLVNGNTASASELLSSALRDNLNVPLIGTKSFGKSIAQEGIVLQEDGSGLVITISQYYTKSGYNIQGKGLVPDYEVELNKDYAKVAVDNIPEGKDNQLNKAIEVVTKASNE